MEEEEGEVTVEGSELHKYLMAQGYTDFEVINNFQTSSKKLSINNKILEDCEGLSNDSIATFDFIQLDYIRSMCTNYLIPYLHLKIEEHFHKQIETILKSSLLFSEDIDAVELFRRDKKVITFKLSGVKPALLSNLAAVACGGCIVLFKLLNKFWLITSSIALSGFTLYMTCSMWRSYKKMIWENQLSVHINTLQYICGTVQKLLRFLRETEVISTGKLPTSNLGSVSYFGSRLWEIDPQPLPSWKTLPDLRRFISEQLIQLAVTISCCSDSIKELLPSSIYLKISYPNIYSSKTVLYQVLGMQINICQECIPLSDLQKLNEMYLLIQSDYLKNLSWCFCSSLWLNTFAEGISTIYNTIIKTNQGSLCAISSQLKVQYKIYLVSPSSMSNIVLIRNPPVHCITIRNELHNISLQLYSLLWQIREYEDMLEEMNEEFAVLHVHQNHSQMLNNVESVFHHIKNSLIKTSDLSKKTLNVTNKSDEVNEQTPYNKNQPNIKTTGVHVGTSNFEIKTDNVDVFIGVCDDENNPQIDNHSNDLENECKLNVNLRHNVLKELMMNLESRKKQFVEKEKLALERKGLFDIDSSDDDSTTAQLHKHNLSELKHHNEHLNTPSNVPELSHTDSSNLQPRPFPYQINREMKLCDEVTSIYSSWGRVSNEEEFISNVSDSGESDD